MEARIWANYNEFILAVAQIVSTNSAEMFRI